MQNLPRTWALPPFANLKAIIRSARRSARRTSTISARTGRSRSLASRGHCSRSSARGPSRA
eukprot:3515557-Pyramimonas_sp.AAC.1